MLEWDLLSMKLRAAFIRNAVARGIYNVEDIVLDYNEFRKGGPVETPIYEDLPKMLRKAGLDIKVTSGYRLAGTVGTAGLRSWHHRHGAVDIVPQGNTTFEDIENVLHNNPAIRQYMLSHNFGLIDESGRTPESKLTMKKTGATGAHFHIGKDSKYAALYRLRVGATLPEGDRGKTVYFTNPFLSLEQPTQLVLVQSTVTPEEILQNVTIPEPIKSDDIQATAELPEVEVIGHQPQVNPLTILSLIQESASTPLVLEPYLIPLILNKVNEIATERNSFLQKDLEDRILAEERRRRLGYSYRDGSIEDDIKLMLFLRNMSANGGNLFDGTSQPSQQMNIGLKAPKIGLNVQGWPNYTIEQIVAYGDENERRRKAILDAYLNFVIESNDATSVANGRPQNQHLVDKAVRGAKANAAWEKEHPNLTAWSYLPSAVTIGTALAPLGAAGWAGISALGDAAAATSVGQGITNFLAPIATTSYAGATVPQWFDLGLSSIFGGHGVQTAIDEGGVSPMTALEVAPLGRMAKPMLNAGKEGLQYTVKVADNVARNISPSYDLYRTIGETAPSIKSDLFTGYWGQSGFSPSALLYSEASKPYPMTSLKFFERNPKKISKQEFEGIPSAERNNIGGVHPDNIFGDLRFIRNIDGLPTVDKNGLVHLAKDSENLLANFSTDLPFRLHPWYPVAPGSTYMVVSPRAFTGKQFLSINPGDSFLPSTDAVVSPNFVRIISGDKTVLEGAEQLGMRTSTSPLLQDLYNTGTSVAQKEYELGLNGAVRPFQNADNAASNLKWRDELDIDYPKEGVVIPYRQEVDRIITDEIGRPSLQDYQTLEEMTNLNAGLSPIFNESLINKASDPLASQKMFKNVFYSATPNVEESLMNSIGLYPGPRQGFFSTLKLDKWLKENEVRPISSSAGTISRTPQITAENAASITPEQWTAAQNADIIEMPSASAGLDFSSPLGNDVFTKFLYQNKISGKPMTRTDAMEFVNGEFVPILKEFADDVVKGLSPVAKEHLMHNTIERNIREFENAGYDAIMNQLYRDKVSKLLDDVNVGRYTDEDYIKAGKIDLGGFYDNNRNFISINEGSGFPAKFVEKHEGRHLIDYNTSMLDEQENILSKAYDDDFLNIPNTEFAGSLKDYKLMHKERVTTNRDARDVLLGDTYSKWDLTMQDKVIDKMPDERIFNAVEKANGYGRRYIEYLRANNKLTPEKALQFREAMKHVGAIALPIGLTGYGLFNNQEAYGGQLNTYPDTNSYEGGGDLLGEVRKGSTVDIDQCAQWSNGLLRNNGYLINGNAWNLGNVDMLFNGFEGLEKPEAYDRKMVEDYNHAAADSVYRNFDSKTLDTSRPYVVNMYYNNSPAQEEAFNDGKGVTGTHTGVLTYDEPSKSWLVTHNIHGRIHQEPFISLQSGKGKYGVTAVYEPRKATLWNRAKGFFGFNNGGYLSL